MGILKKPKNKRFNYKPRFLKHDGEGSPFDIKHKFDDQRTTANPASGLKGRFNAAFNDLKRPQEKKVIIRLVIIMAILILIFLYIIDFDLSIFKTK